MKKILFLLVSFIFTGGVFGYCTDYSSSTQSNIDAVKSSISFYQSLTYSNNSSKISDLNNQLSQLQTELQEDKKDYQLCILFEKGLNAYNRGDYIASEGFYLEYISVAGTNNINYEAAKNNLVLSMNQLISISYAREDWKDVIARGKTVMAYDSLNVFALRKMGDAYLALNDLNNAETYYNIAYKNAKSSEDLKNIKISLDYTKSLIKEQDLKKKAPSNDPFSYLQYYLTTLNIPTAWSKVKNSNEVVVAIIDDGININHPDLIGNIWVNPIADYGKSKVIDFVGDNIDNIMVGDHGTMVAGLIGANINNKIGIAGIAKNVKLMPLRIFGFDENGAKEENIIRAINYAIDNGANIINLSFGSSSQFTPYTDIYDAIIKRAYEKGIVVVIAAGNGDTALEQYTGIDLKINPLTPVCNNQASTKYSIGVAAEDEKGFRTSWTNYNSCISVYAPGVDIVSTSIPIFNSKYGIDYSEEDGTSFSAPIVAGIIALGFNEYGFVPPDIVQIALSESLKKNKSNNYQIDASRYLDALAKRIDIIKLEQDKQDKSITDKIAIDYAFSDADVLADFGIITKKETQAEYRLESNVLRQEVIGMAIKLAGITLPTDYVCKNIFSDIAALKPNNWVCRSAEIGVENGIVSGTNKKFNPEANITRAEALAILMNAAGIKTQESTISKFADVTVPWQINIVNTAFSYNFIDMATSFYPNRNATRGEIFTMAKRILKSKI